MANLATIGDYASALKNEQGEKGRLVVEVAGLKRQLKRAPAAERKAAEAVEAAAALRVERDEALRQLDASKRVIRDRDATIQQTQRELEELRAFKAAVSLVSA